MHILHAIVRHVDLEQLFSPCMSGTQALPLELHYRLIILATLATLQAILGINLLLRLLNIDSHVCDDATAVEAHLVGLQRLDDSIGEQMLPLFQVKRPVTLAQLDCVMEGAATHHMAAPIRFDIERKSPAMGMLSSKLAAKPNTYSELKCLMRKPPSSPRYAHLRSSIHLQTAWASIPLVSK